MRWIILSFSGILLIKNVFTGCLTAANIARNISWREPSNWLIVIQCTPERVTLCVICAARRWKRSYHWKITSNFTVGSEILNAIFVALPSLPITASSATRRYTNEGRTTVCSTFATYARSQWVIKAHSTSTWRHIRARSRISASIAAPRNSFLESFSLFSLPKFIIFQGSFIRIG